MPALIKVSPNELKQILILDGWRMHRQDLLNWSLVKGEAILVIPKQGKVVSFEVRDHALEVAEMSPGRYLELRAQVLTSKVPTEIARIPDSPPSGRVQ